MSRYMEKKKPHYSLNLAKQLIREGHFSITLTAKTSALNGFNLQTQGILDSIENLTPKDFYKSMTTHHDHRLWQDVYKPIIKQIPAYVKIQIMNNKTVVISFKEADA